MNTITVIMEADADGTLHLPLPEEFRHGMVEVTAILRIAPAPGSDAAAPSDRVALRRVALRELRALGGLRDSIPDPVAWQREGRADRVLPDQD